uniref:Putative polygalacturonase inhibitor n=1 Tax=Davidia involucrata TaxID=16924 RepID=A0A5B7BHW8_DAVIN
MQTPPILSILSLCFLLFLSLPLPSLSLSSHRCNPNDKKALLKIKQAFGNPYHLASWDPKHDCCDWYCVKCDPTTNRITDLTIFSTSDISGQIPPSVADLLFLGNLVFRKLPNLTGNIPPFIAKLTHLRYLTLSWTNLSGPVPSFLSQLRNLTFIDLSYNKLTGAISPSLSELQNLDDLHLDRNKLTGSIPDSFGHFRGNVPSLYLSHNQLTGSVPKSLGGLNFPHIDFSRNRLVGDISFLFGSRKTIQIMDFSRNFFAFDLSKVKFPASLTWLDLSHNKITGRLPAGLTGMDFQNLNVSYNQLCGRIPTGGVLQSLDYSSYFHNRCLCGAPLPACK